MNRHTTVCRFDRIFPNSTENKTRCCQSYLSQQMAEPDAVGPKTDMVKPNLVMLGSGYSPDLVRTGPKSGRTQSKYELAETNSKYCSHQPCRAKLLQTEVGSLLGGHFATCLQPSSQSLAQHNLAYGPLEELHAPPNAGWPPSPSGFNGVISPIKLNTLSA